MSNLFSSSEPAKKNRKPLAETLRPTSFDEIYGQDHLTGEGTSLRQMVQSRQVASLILWGPAGCGKTTMARLIAQGSGLNYEQISAIFSGVSDLRKIFDTARLRRQEGTGTLLFVDEIHRFNKAQQDAFLPVVEDGTIILIGATTENPSFELNAALLSRCQVYVLKRLDNVALRSLIGRAEKTLGQELPLTDDAWPHLIAMADGDGRYLLNLVEQIYHYCGVNNAQGREANGDTVPVGIDELAEIAQQRRPLYDKGDDGHYNLISALHKSVRGSDPDASLYWLCRMIEGGEDPQFIARRLVRMAVEDIGLADPQALDNAVAGWQAFERLGSPEGELALANVVIYLATAPKSNAAYKAYKKAAKDARGNGSLMPPKHILNAPTSLMEKQGYASGYIYDHDTREAFSGQDYFPEEMKRKVYYQPVQRGFEREIFKRLEYWDGLRKKKNS